MNEKKKTIIILVILLLIFMLLPVSLYLKHTNGQKILEVVNDYYKNEENSLIYIGSVDCSYCAKFDPIIEKVAQNYDFNYLYVELTDLTSQQQYTLLENLDIDANDFGTPYLVIGKKGEKEVGHVGYMSEVELEQLLKSSGYLDEDAEPINKTDDEDTDALNFIDVSEFKDLVNDDEKSIVVLSQIGCPYCTYAKPELNNIAKEKNVIINIIEIDLIFNEDEINEFYEITDELGIVDVRTPYIMVIQNGKILDEVRGYAGKEVYLEMFERQGLINN